MSSQSRQESSIPKKGKGPTHPDYDFYYYPDSATADAKSADIGFPIFCCHWSDDGTVFIGGGGGLKGTGVPSALVAARLTDGEASLSDKMTEHSFSPWDPYAVERDLPKDPVLQTVGEVLTADEIVSSISTVQIPWSTRLSNTSPSSPLPSSVTSSPLFPSCRAMACSVADTTIVFTLRGVGAIGRGPLSPYVPKPTNNPPSKSKSTSLSQTDITPIGVFDSTSPLLHPNFSPTSQSLSEHQRLALLAGVPLVQNQPPAGSGHPKLSPLFRFRSDYWPTNGLQSTCVWSHDATRMITGGQDGIVRVFLVDDPEIFITIDMTDPSNPTQSPDLSPSIHRSSHPCRVSPLSLAIGKHTDCITRLELTPDGSHVLSISDSVTDGILAWPIPSADTLRIHGNRIPHHPTARDRNSPGSQPAVNGASLAPNAAKPQRRPKPTRPETLQTAILDYPTAFIGIDDVIPSFKIALDDKEVPRSLAFWTPLTQHDSLIMEKNNLSSSDNKTTNTLSSEHNNLGKLTSNDPYEDELILQQPGEWRKRRDEDCLLVLCSQPRGNSYLCVWRVPHTAYKRDSKKGVTLSESSASSGNQNSPSLLTKELVAEKQEAFHLCISPDRQFLGISSSSMHVFTSPSSQSVRSYVLSQRGVPLTSPLVSASPLTQVCERKDVFELPCTGVAFDPSSRLMLATSAARAVFMLPIEPPLSQPSSLRRACRTCCNVACCCCIWRRLFSREMLYLLLNLLLVALLAGAINNSYDPSPSSSTPIEPLFTDTLHQIDTSLDPIYHMGQPSNPSPSLPKLEQTVHKPHPHQPPHSPRQHQAQLQHKEHVVAPPSSPLPHPPPTKAKSLPNVNNPSSSLPHPKQDAGGINSGVVNTQGIQPTQDSSRHRDNIGPGTRSLRPIEEPVDPMVESIALMEEDGMDGEGYDNDLETANFG